VKRKSTPLARERARANRLRSYVLGEIGRAYGGRLTDAENEIKDIGHACRVRHAAMTETIERNVRGEPVPVAQLRSDVADMKAERRAVQTQMFESLANLSRRLGVLEHGFSRGISPERTAALIADLSERLRKLEMAK
jgi:hypothetical protein